MMKTDKTFEMTPTAQKHVGSAAVALGLLDMFMSFGLLITRKNNGETHYNWLGADDYFVLSCLFMGGGLMAWAGKGLYMAGYTQNILQTAPTLSTSRISIKDDSLKRKLTTEEVQIKAHRDTAYQYALAASGTFLVMSFYAFLGGFNGTPTPESQIGPRQSSDLQMTGFFMLYGVTAIAAVATMLGMALAYPAPKQTVKHANIGHH